MRVILFMIVVGFLGCGRAYSQSTLMRSSLNYVGGKMSNDRSALYTHMHFASGDLTSSRYRLAVGGLYNVAIKGDAGGTVTTVENELLLEVYPNPASRQLVVSNRDHLLEALEIYDTSGKMISKIPLDNSFRQLIDIEHLEAGQYLLRILVGNSWITKRIIKQ